MHTLWWAVAILIGSFALWQWLRIRYYAQIGEQLVARSQAVSNTPQDPDRSVLIIGNSLWAGVGATDPDDSLAGRLVADLPGALVVNQAVAGAKVADGRKQLEQAIEEHGNFDQIIIQLGANDIVDLTNLAEAKRDLKVLLTRAQEVGQDIAYMVSGSVGYAPVFLQPLDWFYTAVSRRYIEHFASVSESVGVLYIDLFREREADPFYMHPDKYFAADKFHPSGAGYVLWYDKCQEELQCFEYE